MRLDARGRVRLAQGLQGPWPAQLSAACRRRCALPAPRSAPGRQAAISDRATTRPGHAGIGVQFELQLPPEVPHDYLGSRVYVRFEHGAEPVGQRLWRATRRAFLSHFHV